MQQNTQRHIDHNAIAARAYELYLARGCEPGHAMEDWLRAEAELRRAPITEKPAVQPTAPDVVRAKPAKKGNGRK